MFCNTISIAFWSIPVHVCTYSRSESRDYNGWSRESMGVYTCNTRVVLKYVNIAVPGIVDTTIHSNAGCIAGAGRLVDYYPSTLLECWYTCTLLDTQLELCTCAHNMRVSVLENYACTGTPVHVYRLLHIVAVWCCYRYRERVTDLILLVINFMFLFFVFCCAWPQSLFCPFLPPNRRQ